MPTSILVKSARVIVCLFVLAALFSCDDHRLVVGNERFRLKTDAARSFKAGDFRTYNYTTDNKLSSIVYTFSSSSTLPSSGTTVFSYDAQKRLVKATGPITYDYDGNGRINLVSVFSAALTPISTYTLEYGTGAFPTKITQTNLTKSNTYTTYTQVLTYNNGNVASISESYDGGAATTTSYTYDDKLNPFFGLIRGAPDFISFNKNNIAAGSNSFGPEILTYDAKGLLLKREFGRETDAYYLGRIYSYETY